MLEKMHSALKQKEWDKNIWNDLWNNQKHLVNPLESYLIQIGKKF